MGFKPRKLIDARGISNHSLACRGLVTVLGTESVFFWQHDYFIELTAEGLQRHGFIRRAPDNVQYEAWVPPPNEGSDPPALVWIRLGRRKDYVTAQYLIEWHRLTRWLRTVRVPTSAQDDQVEIQGT